MELSYTKIFINLGLPWGPTKQKPTYIYIYGPHNSSWSYSYIKFSRAQPYELGVMDISQEVSGKFPPRVFLNGWMAAVSVGNRGEREWNAMMELLGS